MISIKLIETKLDNINSYVANNRELSGDKVVLDVVLLSLNNLRDEIKEDKK